MKVYIAHPRSRFTSYACSSSSRYEWGQLTAFNSSSWFPICNFLLTWHVHIYIFEYNCSCLSIFATLKQVLISIQSSGSMSYDGKYELYIVKNEHLV